MQDKKGRGVEGHLKEVPKYATASALPTLHTSGDEPNNYIQLRRSNIIGIGVEAHPAGHGDRPQEHSHGAWPAECAEQ